ncbi:hypothetical protein DEO72_LG2g3048 [Vigna unguiculata]|uniref:Uncharacterized protein n=1 Tax=Vigna unguiculata TaxID=3917 RepID=A0A4D6L2J4_VIGUN|nr:hypothetical protein DEO72_LG2g3048 [Vigna unguiculata]
MASTMLPVFYVEFPIQITFVTSQDYQTRWSHTKEGNLSGPVVCGTTRTLTLATLANPSHNSRVPNVHRHPEPQLKRYHSEPQLKECHVLNPYPEPQLKGYVLSHNSRNPASQPSRVAMRNSLPDRLAGDTCRQAPSASNATVSASITWWDNPYRQAPP